MDKSILGESFFARLEKQDKEYGEQVRRWSPKVNFLSFQLRKLTHEPLQDIVSEFLEKMWVDVQAFRTPQVRYEKKIYTVLSEDNGQLHLRRSGVDRIVDKTLIETVKKPSMFTYVYAGIVQYYCDRCSRMFTSKNGYVVDPEKPSSEVTVVTKLKRQVKTKTFPNYVRVAGIRANIISDDVDLDPLDTVPNELGTPEDQLVYCELVEFVRERLSDPAKELFSFLLQENDDFSTQSSLVILNHQTQKLQVPIIKADRSSAAKFLQKSAVDIKQLFNEIISAFPVSFKVFDQFNLATKGVV
jgi:hypothetical protein